MESLSLASYMDWPHCSGERLSIDQACLQVQSTVPVDLWKQISACIQCDLQLVGSTSSFEEFIVGSQYQTDLAVISKSFRCNYTYHFGEAGSYLLNFNDSNVEECPSIEVVTEPNNPFTALWIFFGLSLLWLILAIIISLKKRYVSHLPELQNDLGRLTPEGSVPENIGSRLLDHDGLSNGSGNNIFHPIVSRISALDTFRGLTIALMILVNSGGGGYALLQHSVWDGLTLADLVFPWFAWIMGVAIVNSTSAALRALRSKLKVIWSIFKRATALFIIGIIINAKNSLELDTLRIPGVLQRLGIAYLIVATLFTVTVKHNIAALLCIITAFGQVYVSASLPVPGCPTGYIGPGGLSQHGKYLNCTGGAASYIDRLVFSDRHMYSGGPWNEVYSTIMKFDPEGLMGVLSMCSLVLLGCQVGLILRFHSDFANRYIHIAARVIFYGLIGGWLCDWRLSVLNPDNWLFAFSSSIPVNKPLWSLSFTFLACSSAGLVFLGILILQDYFSLWSGWPFTALGRNSLLIYFCSVMLGDSFPWAWAPFTPGHGERLFMNIWAVSLWTIVASSLHSRQIYFTL